MAEIKECATFESLIEQRLSGEMKEVALNIANYLNENQLAPVQSGEVSCWKVPYNGKCIAGMWVGEHNNLDVHFWYLDFSGEIDADTADIITSENHYQCCYICHDGCTGGFDTSVFGREIKNLCSQHTIQFNSPAKSDLPHIKNMIEYSKKYISGCDVSYHAKHF